MARLSLSLFGPLSVTCGGKLVKFATDKDRALLVYLATASDQPHRRDMLAGLLWPDQPDKKARHSLRQALTSLRKTLGVCPPLSDDAYAEDTSFLLVSRETIQFNPVSDFVLDTAEFTTFYESCQQHRHRHISACLPCLQRLEAMVGLYKGDFLEEFSLRDSAAFEEWAMLKREWYHLHVVEALTILARYYELRGDFATSRKYLELQVHLEPWREEAHRQLMRLLASDGQRSAALAQYKMCQRALDRELGVQPTSETVALYEAIRAAAGQVPASRTIFSGLPEAMLRYPDLILPLDNLPPPSTPFVGRMRELDMLTEWLSGPDCRLITLMGGGGIGKSRLALQVARKQRGLFEHGVWFVPLAAVSTPDLLVSAIIESLKVPIQGRQELLAQLLNYLRKKSLLLVLDNAERILAGAPILAEILQQAKGVILLATSRARLNLREEWVFPVEGLTYPVEAPGEGGAPEVSVVPWAGNACGGSGDREAVFYSAVALFEQRARQVGGVCDVGARPAIVRICQLVEGMPLGVELAAAATSFCSCDDIVRELEHSFDILATSPCNVPERHRSMRATFAYSWRLLTETERQVFARLGVFCSAFTYIAASAVTGISVNLLRTLVDKSLVRHDGKGRYQVHQLLRQFARERLAQVPDDLSRTHDRHAAYYADLFYKQVPRLRGREQLDALQIIQGEMDNMRAAWAWAMADHDYALLAEALDGIVLFYIMQGLNSTGEAFCSEAVVALTKVPEENSTLLGRMLIYQGAFACCLGNYDGAEAHLKRGLACLQGQEGPMFSEGGNNVDALNALGDVARLKSDYDTAEDYYRAALAHGKIAEDTLRIAASYTGLGGVAYRRGEYASARDYFKRCLELQQTLGCPGGISDALNDLGIVTYRLGDYETARRFLMESLSIKTSIQDRGRTPPILNNLGLIADVTGAYEEALHWYQKSLEIREMIGEQWGIALGFNNMGVVMHRLGNYDMAHRYHNQSLFICRQLRDQRGIANALTNLGLVAQARGACDEAERLYREALTLREEIGDRRGIGWSTYHLGDLATVRGDLSAARRWLESSLALWREMGDPWGQLFALNGWGHLMVALRCPDEARTALAEVIEQAVSRRTPAVALRALAAWAALLVQDGDLSQALELAMLIQEHPAAEYRTKMQAANLVDTIAPRTVIPKPPRTLETVLADVISSLAR